MITSQMTVRLRADATRYLQAIKRAEAMMTGGIKDRRPISGSVDEWMIYADELEDAGDSECELWRAAAAVIDGDVRGWLTLQRYDILLHVMIRWTATPGGKLQSYSERPPAVQSRAWPMTYQMCWAQLATGQDFIRRGNLILSLPGGGEIETSYIYATETDYERHEKIAVVRRVEIRTAYDPMAEAAKSDGEFFYPSMVQALFQLFQREAEQRIEQMRRQHIMMMSADYNMKVMDQRRIIRGGM